MKIKMIVFKNNGTFYAEETLDIDRTVPAYQIRETVETVISDKYVNMQKVFLPIDEKKENQFVPFSLI